MSASALKRLVACFLLASMTVLAHAGTVTGTIQKPNSQPLANGVISFALSQAGVTQAGSITLTSDTSYCGTSSTGIVVGITDPGIADVLSANYGAGTLPAATYYVEYTYTSASGESFTSPENIFLMTGSGTLNGNAPTVQPANATGYKVYIGTTSGGETLQTTVTGFAGWSQSTTLAAGAAPPVSNTTLCNTLFFNDSIIPSYTTYLVNLIDGQGKQVSGYPQRYYLQGTTVDLSTLAPSGNLTARFPSAIVAQPLANSLQSIAGPLSLGTYGLTVGSVTSPIFRSSTANPAQSGVIRLASGDVACWRNNANGADDCVSKNASDQLVWAFGLNLTGGALITGGIGLDGASATAQSVNGPSGWTLASSGTNLVQFTPTSITALKAMNFNVSQTTTNAGVFTNTQMNLYSQSLINSCNPLTEYQAAQTVSNFSTDAITGCVRLPLSSAIHQVNGVAGYAVNLGGSDVGGGAVGGYFSGRVLANSVAAWGINPLVQDAVGVSGTQMISQESDINVLGTPARVWGILVTGASSGTMPAFGSSAGVEVRSPGYALANALKWPSGLNIVEASSTSAIDIGATAYVGTNTVSSMPITFHSRDSGGVAHTATISGSQGGAITLNSLTVATLPSASANPGGMAYVTDSTTVSAEGQTCAGSSSTKALAFSNGTVWKCF